MDNVLWSVTKTATSDFSGLHELIRALAKSVEFDVELHMEALPERLSINFLQHVKAIYPNGKVVLLSLGEPFTPERTLGYFEALLEQKERKLETKSRSRMPVGVLNNVKFQTYCDEHGPTIQALKAESLTHQEICDRFNLYGPARPRGGTWYPAHVSQILKECRTND